MLDKKRWAFASEGCFSGRIYPSRPRKYAKHHSEPTSVPGGSQLLNAMLKGSIAPMLLAASALASAAQLSTIIPAFGLVDVQLKD